ncbi:CDK2-associated and cullin domain-containing protein 1-like [Penaeus chinensis]|uniref:CDK2-associated and cullin domain-containing protein 1-like n=1 Tax=Penaeus chinensis TaxID=139456 RepID=UPI001FB5981B|nr:CDK2-associated and cullin domain-containing protein 1-like [Penaeus chinensis]
MEESMSSADQNSSNTPRRALAMTSMSDEDYCNTYWPQLREAVDRLLQGPPSPPHTGPVIQFEPMYSAAYKCVCQQYSEALYNDLTSHINKHFLKVAADMQDVGDLHLIDSYYSLIHRVMYSLDGIIPIFTYLNRVYVETKLSSTLRTELQKIFCTAVIDPVIARLLALIKHITEAKPFYVAPHVLASLVKNLYKLRPAYAQTYPQVFSVYIPGVLPAMGEHELSDYIAETQKLQATLRQSWINTSSQGRKRCLDEEMLT